MKLKLKNASGGVGNRNKGAISLEYVLVIVVVVLACLVGMKIFGSKIGETINNSKDAVVNTTDSVFNRLGGTASGGSGGSGSSAGIDMTSINVTDGSTVLAAGDFSTKGNLVIINGTQYRVLEVNDTQAKVMSMENAGNSKFNSSSVTTSFGSKTGQKYAGSVLDGEMTNFYNSLPVKLQNAIVEQNISQSMYKWSSGTNATADFSAWYAHAFTDATTSGSNYYLTRTAEVNVGARKVFTLDVDDVISYLGSTSTPQDLNELFFNQRSSVVHELCEV